MKVAVIRFPGSNCDQDAYYALNNDLGIEAKYVWHEDHSLTGFDAVFLPGGFSYGDYLRCGAMASRAPIMDEVKRFADNGYPVIGACNGFQVLCEAGILPGALLLNAKQKFLCKQVMLEAVNKSSIWTQGVNKPINVPIAHGEGRYVCENEVLKRLRNDNQIAFRYVPKFEGDVEYNPNGSMDDIAGVVNKQGNVLGLMPHPERATREILGSADGLMVLKALTLLNA
ncbi:MAG TPA: phosphoribosylformylglycinamidine synthase subunit PurQ [Fimbriimonadaceae bacterium]|jgi:phosphoribosylformylglycinamidine synthase